MHLNVRRLMFCCLVFRALFLIDKRILVGISALPNGSRRQGSQSCLGTGPDFPQTKECLHLDVRADMPSFVVLVGQFLFHVRTRCGRQATSQLPRRVSSDSLCFAD
jgi:hypothetical protein